MNKLQPSSMQTYGAIRIGTLIAIFEIALYGAKALPDCSVNCIFADPPYFMQSTTDKSGKEKKLMRGYR